MMSSDSRATTDALRATAADIRDAVLAFAESNSSEAVREWWERARAHFERLNVADTPMSELRDWMATTLSALSAAFSQPDGEAFAVLETQLISLVQTASRLLTALQTDAEAMHRADALVAATAQWVSDVIVHSLAGDP